MELNNQNAGVGITLIYPISIPTKFREKSRKLTKELGIDTNNA